MRGKEHWWSRRQFFFLFPMGIQKIWAGIFEVSGFHEKNWVKDFGFIQIFRVNMLEFTQKIEIFGRKKPNLSSIVRSKIYS